jgi:hypothetical protein
MTEPVKPPPQAPAQAPAPAQPAPAQPVAQPATATSKSAAVAPKTEAPARTQEEIVRADRPTTRVNQGALHTGDKPTEYSGPRDPNYEQRRA